MLTSLFQTGILKFKSSGVFQEYVHILRFSFPCIKNVHVPGRLEKEDLNAKLGKLSKRIEEVKVEVYDSLQLEYGNFYPTLDTAHDLSQRVNTMTEDMQGVSSRIETEVRQDSFCL